MNNHFQSSLAIFSSGSSMKPWSHSFTILLRRRHREVVLEPYPVGARSSVHVDHHAGARSAVVRPPSPAHVAQLGILGVGPIHYGVDKIMSTIVFPELFYHPRVSRR